MTQTPSIPTRIVLTGGPGAGKTVVSRALAQAQPRRFVAAPEAASQIYAMLQTRWDRLDDAGRREVQRRIYQLQLQQEADLAALHPQKIHLLDRGTVDGSAYWPDGPEDYWRQVGTTVEAEMGRYAAVIWLQTCAVLEGLYDAQGSNPCRYESADLAIAAGELQRAVWRDHPSFHVAEAAATIEQKIERVMGIIDAVRSLRKAEG